MAREITQRQRAEALDAMYRQQLDDRDKTIHNLRESAKIWEERHATVQGERERYKWLVQQLYTDLPAKRDWLDPAIERELAALAQPAAPSARGRMHSCDIPECVACGNPPDIEEKQEGRDELR